MKLLIRNRDNSIFKSIDIKRGALLSEVLRIEGIELNMPCGKMGRCGKCKVRFVSGESVATDADRRCLTESEIEKGYRLSCRSVLMGDCEIEIPNNMEMLKDKDAHAESELMFGSAAEKIQLAVDIGTTTIAAEACGTKTWNKTVMNHQRAFGADVISRIKAANEGKAYELRKAVLDDLKSLIPENVGEIILAGNTTMMHLLMGDSCEGLGKSPYKPVRLSYPSIDIDGLFDIKVRSFPGISAFVGADIVSGMYALGFDNIPKGETYMLLDLGTNGEMAVADSEKITVCSTAAGPVFEGGGISCGMAGIQGAIEHVTIDYESGIMAKVEVIGEKQKPIGICGSGVLELVSELRRCEIIDETGLLVDEYFEKGFPVVSELLYFTQNDIRELQLAKAAIRSGIDTLLESHGCSAAGISKVYLAGGFSEHLDPEKVKYLKMLPEEFLKKKILVSAGNTSLLRCKKAMGDSGYEKKAINIVEKATEIPLANTDTFGASFIEAMNF